jgi:hypothetical protein
MYNTAAAVRMQALLDRWEATADPRAIFLDCYLLMTRAMLAALDRAEFRDPVWVGGLLEHFAGYYFVAVEVYDANPAAAPQVWRLAHDMARDPDAQTLQKLMVGVSAHINYDLVLALSDLLAPDWATLSADQRAARYADHCHINAVIARTIDAVQDRVLEPAVPGLGTLDALLGPLDELLISRLITGWRQTVWQHATQLLETPDPTARAAIVAQVEADALAIGRIICRPDVHQA